MFETTVREGVCRLSRPGTRWLATGWCGGYRAADAAYNATVPEGFERTDLDAYAAERRRQAGFRSPGPTLLTGVDVRHARRATSGDVTVVATVGLSNLAALPVPSADGFDREPPADPASNHARSTDSSPAPSTASSPVPSTDSSPAPSTGPSPAPSTDPSPAPTPSSRTDSEGGPDDSDGRDWRPGTVNLLVGTRRSLADGPLAGLLSTCVEAKAATLSALVDVPGTTSDAVAVGCVPDGQPASFAGSATAVGAAARACVRDAILASFAARYDGDEPPASVENARNGVVTDRSATVERP